MLTFSSLFPIFFPLPLPDRNVRTKDVLSLVFTMMVTSPCRPFSAVKPLCGNRCPGYSLLSFPGERVLPRATSIPAGLAPESRTKAERYYKPNQLVKEIICIAVTFLTHKITSNQLPVNFINVGGQCQIKNDVYYIADVSGRAASSVHVSRP